MKSRILGFNLWEFVDVWSFMNLYIKWWNWWFLTWNDVHTCYKLYFYVYCAYTCLKLSPLCFGLMKFQDLRVFHQKLENKVLLSWATRRGEWRASTPVASGFARSELPLSSPSELISAKKCHFLENIRYMLILWFYYDPMVV
jgi:hypothetical protein